MNSKKPLCDKHFSGLCNNYNTERNTMKTKEKNKTIQIVREKVEMKTKEKNKTIQIVRVKVERNMNCERE